MKEASRERQHPHQPAKRATATPTDDIPHRVRAGLSTWLESLAAHATIGVLAKPRRDLHNGPSSGSVLPVERKRIYTLLCFLLTSGTTSAREGSLCALRRASRVPLFTASLLEWFSRVLLLGSRLLSDPCSGLLITRGLQYSAWPVKTGCHVFVCFSVVTAFGVTCANEATHCPTQQPHILSPGQLSTAMGMCKALSFVSFVGLAAGALLVAFHVGFTTVPDGEASAVWELDGTVSVVEGPALIWSLGKRVSALQRFTAAPKGTTNVRARHQSTLLTCTMVPPLALQSSWW